MLRALVLACACVLCAQLAAAQPSEADRRHAQLLFDRGRALLDEGRFSEACPLFAASQKLDPGGGTLLNLAVCHDKEGRLATAHAEYNEALSLAIRDGRDDRKQIAQEGIAALAPRIPQLRFELPKNVPADELTITVDGAVVPRLAWSALLPVDPGTHRVTASAPAHQKYETDLTIAEAKNLVVRLPDLVPLPAPKPKPEPAPIATEMRVSTASWVVGGAGALVLGASAVTGVLALVADGNADDAAERADCLPGRDFCRRPGALDEAESESDRARTWAWISTGTLVAGSAALVTAWLLPREPVSVSADVAASGASVRLGLAW